MKQIFEEFGLNLSAAQMNAFEQYYELLIDYNKSVNLTAITKKDAVYIKHFLDSVAAHSLLPVGSTVIDIGTGAGFPSIPLLIVRSDLRFLLVDSLNKRINFLKTLKNQLNLDFECIHARAEDLKCRESYDFAVSRAVAALPTLLEWTIPFVKVGGKMIAYKSQSAHEEIAAAKNAIGVLNCNINQIKELTLPDGAKRNLVVLQKLAKTPTKYPRKGKKQPL